MRQLGVIGGDSGWPFKTAADGCCIVAIIGELGGVGSWVASDGLACDCESVGIGDLRLHFSLLISRIQSPMDVSRFCKVKKKFRRQYHSGDGGKCLTGLSERRTRAERRRGLQVEPCNALAYLAGQTEGAIGSNAGKVAR